MIAERLQASLEAGDGVGAARLLLAGAQDALGPVPEPHRFGEQVAFVRELADLGLDALARRAIDALDGDAEERMTCWSAAVRAAHGAGRGAAARAFARLAADETAIVAQPERDVVRAEATELLAEVGDLGGAGAVADAVVDAPLRIRAFEAIARAALSAGAADVAADAVRALEAAAAEGPRPAARRFGPVEDHPWVAELWGDVGAAFAASSRPEEARAAFQAAWASCGEDPFVDPWLLAEVVGSAVGLTGTRAFDDAVAVRMPDARERSILAVAVAGSLARAGRLGEAIARVRTIEDRVARALALLDVAVADAGGAPRADHPWLHEAAGWLRDHEEASDVGAVDPELRVRGAEALGRAGWIELALASARGAEFGTGVERIADSLHRAGVELAPSDAVVWALLRVGTACEAAGRWLDAVRAYEQALADARRLRRVEATTALARVAQRFLARGGADADAGLAYVAAWPDASVRAEALARLGGVLSSQAVRRATFAVLDDIEDATLRADARLRLVTDLAAGETVAATELAAYLGPEPPGVALLAVARAAARQGDVGTFAIVAPKVLGPGKVRLVALQVARLVPEVAEDVAGVLDITAR